MEQVEMLSIDKAVFAFMGKSPNEQSMQNSKNRKDFFRGSNANKICIERTSVMSLVAAASSTNVQVSKLGDTSPLAKSMMHIDCKIGKQRREKLMQ